MAKRGSEATERGLLLVHQGSVQWRIVGHQRIGGGGAPSTGVARIFQQGEGKVAKRVSKATERGLLLCASRLCAVAYSGSSTHWGGGGHRALA